MSNKRTRIADGKPEIFTSTTFGGVMKKYLLVLLFVMFSAVGLAQVTIVSTEPVNNTKNVPLITTISVTFSEAIDTVDMKSKDENTTFGNIDSVTSDGFSGDRKTMFANVVLKPNHSYFIAFIYAKAISGAILTTPAVFYFTTGANFDPYSVSGTVLPGSTGVLPEGSIVGLATVNIMKDEGKDGPPPFAAWANVNSNGTFTIPNVANGTYWPLAAKDVNHDGNLDPGNGIDVIVFGDSIIINNASKTDLNLTFMNFSPKTFSESVPIADSLAKNLSADRVLRRISSWDVDTLGRSSSWEFAYTFNNSTGQSIQVQSSGSKTYLIDQNYFDWIKQLKSIINYQSAASSATVIANAEQAGGKAFRLLPHADSIDFRIELSIADQKFSWFGGQGFDTDKIYWSAAYTHQYQVSENQSTTLKGKFFLCDLTTGAVILSQTLGVNNEIVVPKEFSLSQNYPNPFNPATMIEFTLPQEGKAQLKIFNSIGQEVATVFDNVAAGGVKHQVRFNGAHLPSGLYIARLTFEGKQMMKKMMLLK